MLILCHEMNKKIKKIKQGVNVLKEEERIFSTDDIVWDQTNLPQEYFILRD